MKTSLVKKRLWEILTGEHRKDIVSRIFNGFIIILIIVNIIGFILQTEKSINAKYGQELYYLEIISVIIFTIEYICRLVSCSYVAKYKGFSGFVNFIFSPMAIVDLMAILPFYLPFLGLDLRIVRILRLFRIFRIFKIGRYYSSLNMMKNVLVKKKEELVLTTVIMFTMLLLSATLMYYAERDIQPDKFSSIPDAMWWAVITLTTVGYGDVTPLTIAGKVCCSIVAILGIGFFALPIGILGAGFVEEVGNRKIQKLCPHCGGHIH